MQTPGLLDNLQGSLAVVHGDHQQACLGNVHGLQQIGTSAVAVVHVIFAGCRLLDAYRIVIEGNVGDVFAPQEAADGLADPTVAANQYMSLLGFAAGTDGLQ